MDAGIRHPSEDETPREPGPSGDLHPTSDGPGTAPERPDPTSGEPDPQPADAGPPTTDPALLAEEGRDDDVGRTPLFVAGLLLAIVAGGIIDLALDRPRGVTLHVLFEATLVLLSLGTAIYLWRGWARAQRSLRETRQRLRARRAERDAWRERAEDLLRGLGEAIDEQLREWDLTPAERETALLLLEGYSHKRIARETDRSDRTVRQHAVSVYRKSGLSGRAELAGFFLGGLAGSDRDGEEAGTPEPAGS